MEVLNTFAMNPAQLQGFERLTAARTGLHIRDKDKAVFQRLLLSQIKELKLRTPDEYYHLLQSDTEQGKLQWRQLVAHLTNGESYFFRDKGQLALLQNRILPELIERNKAQRSLRLWSAGCSTGEEPYTLAMLVEQLLPQRKDWKVSILGTDISEESLKIAQRAVYGAWSFRMVDPKIRARYFHQQGKNWELDRSIREAVTFETLNLFVDNFPGAPPVMHAMDLIICRNVFIYFKHDAVAAVLPKFADTLAAGGYLMTGHAELNAHKFDGLQPHAFPESVVYQRAAPEYSGRQRTTVNGVLRSKKIPSKSVADKTVASKAKPLPVSRVSHEKAEDAPPDNTALAEADVLFRVGRYDKVVEIMGLLLMEQPGNHTALCLIAHAHANLGQHDEAIEYCRQAIILNSLATDPYRLLAHIREEQGDAEETKRLLKQVIYLSPSLAPAYIELGALYQREGDVTRAQKMRATALKQLKAMSPEDTVDDRGGPTAGVLIQHMEEPADD